MTRPSYDAVGDAFAIVLRDLPSVETLEIATGVLLDLGDDGDPVGLEFLSLAQVAPLLAAHGGRYELPTRSKFTAKSRGTA